MQSREPNVTTGGHPSGINLASIPATQVATARDVLIAVAVEIERGMRLVAASWQQNAAARATDKALYDGMNCALGAVQQQWERLGRRDPILAIMPPTDGYDDNGNEHDGIADYCKLIEQDIPW